MVGKPSIQKKEKAKKLVRKSSTRKKEKTRKLARVAVRAAPKSLPKRLQSHLNHPFTFTHREFIYILQTLLYMEIDRMDYRGRQQPVFSKRAINQLASDFAAAFLQAQPNLVVYFYSEDKDLKTGGFTMISGGTMYWKFTMINNLPYDFKVELKDTYGGEGLEPPNWRVVEKKGQQLYRVPGFISKYKRGDFLMLDLKHYRVGGLKSPDKGKLQGRSSKIAKKKVEEKENVLERYRALKKLRMEKIITESDYSDKAKALMGEERSLSVSEELKLLNYFWMDGLVQEDDYERKKKKLLEKL